MARYAALTVLAGLLAAAAAPAGATPPELACGHFALTDPVLFPRDALVLRTVSPGVDAVVLNGACVSRRARIRRRPDGSVRFVAIFPECGLARGVKVRGRSDRPCSALRGRVLARRPRFRASFEAVAVSEPGCGADGVCAPGTFCELPPGLCTTDLVGGACVPLPDACPDVFLPVCGCDGVTYGNDCERQAAGVSKARDGSCGTKTCFENVECADGSYCAKAPGDCHGAGECRPTGIPCPFVLDPVCGCDGETYGNACQAASAGVNVAHAGACEQRCGTIAGLRCPDGSVCDLQPGMCDGADLGGVCIPKPEVCPEIYAPVCGCDGVTYGNDCERVAAGAQKDRDGTCECVPILCPPDTIPVDTDHDGCDDDCLSARCETNADCPNDRWCTNDAGDCAAPGWCQERPLGCPDVWLPVCGCDGTTYSNECDAAAAGVRTAHPGACLCEPPICPEGTRPHDSNQDGCDDECVPLYACFNDEDCVGVSPDLYCRFADGTCGGAGECREVPVSCSTVVDPVCGCDGVTYVNDCEAALHSQLLHRGPCEPTCGTIAGIPCPDGYVCDLDAGSCFVADAGGRCVEKPGMCPDDNYFPVCGCDGVTYGNDCKRIAAGVTKAHGGACECTGICCPPWLKPSDSTHDGCPDTCASTVIPCRVVCDLDGCRTDCPLPDACETACDCYAKFGDSFCDDCPLLCPNCGDYWQCEAGHCVEGCGPLPPDVIGCLAGGTTG